MGLIDLIDLFDNIEGHKAESPEEIEATKEEKRPTPGQAATPPFGGVADDEAESPLPQPRGESPLVPGPGHENGQAPVVSSPVKHARRRALASTPPPHPGPLIDGQQGPLSFLYSVLRGGRVERGTFISPDIRTEPEALLGLRKRYPELRVQWARLITHPVCSGCRYYTGGVLCNADRSPDYAAVVGSCGQYTRAGEL